MLGVKDLTEAQFEQWKAEHHKVSSQLAVSINCCVRMYLSVCLFSVCLLVHICVRSS